MAESSSAKSSIDPDAIVEEYLRRIDAGEQIDREAYIAAHPDVAPALRSFFANEQLMRQWTAGSVAPAAKDTAPKDGSPTIAPKSVAASALTGATGAITFPAMMGRYRLERELGRGAMGNVYLAHDTDLDRPVALKIPKFTAADNQELIARFLREARAAAVLAHPNICRVYDVNEHQGVRYIAMEFIEGKPLSAFIAGGNVQAKQAASVIRKLALGLAEAHQRNILHRDLKPDNILVNKQGEPVLTDFGLARETTAGKATATQDGVILGSPAYMPPEQAAGNLSEMGPPSDIYSLGVVLYEMLTGEVPFRGSVVEVLASVLMKTPKTVREQKPNVDPGIAAICDKMMAKKAADRYPTMMAVAQALGDWLRTGGQQAAATSSKLPEPLSTSGEFKIADPKSKLAAGPHVVEPKKIPGVSDKPKQTIAPGQSKQTIAPTATKTPERTEKQINELADLGDQLLARNDYLEAIRLAEEIPDYQRTSALRRMLGEAYELKGKVEKLERNLEKYLNTLDLPELKKTVTALLKIHPGHPRGKEIKKALNTGGRKAVVQILKDEGNYDAVGNVWEPKMLAAGLGAIVALAVVAYFAVTIYIKGQMQEVAITIDDPTATVKIDGKDVLIEGQQTGSVKLTLGKHEYTVEKDGVTVKNPQSFTVTKDGENKVVITLKEPKPGDSVAGTTPSDTPKPSGKSNDSPSVFDGHAAGVLSVAVSPDSRFVYSGSDDQSVRGWELATGQEIWKLETGGPTYGLAVSPDGKQVALGSSGGTWIVNAATGEKIQQFTGQGNQTQGVAFTADGAQLATSGVDGEIRLWNIATGKELRVYDRTGNTHTAIVIAPDQSEVFAASGGGTIEAWDFATGKPRDAFQDAAVYGLAFSPDGTLLAGARDDKSAGVWDWKTRKLVHRFDGHGNRVMDVAFLPDGKHLVSGGLDKKMILWNLDTKQKVKEWPAHESGDSLGVRSVAVTPNGQLIVSGGYDAKVRVWKSPLATSSGPSPEFTWELAKSRQAKLTNIKNKAEPLNAQGFNGMFTEIPPPFTKSPAKIFIGDDNIASFDVVEDGFVILTCNYDYQGNDSGGWLEKRWTAEQFAANGWKQLSDAEVGGRLYAAPHKRYQTFFVKWLKQGEKISLSCNKSDPPYLIQFESTGGAAPPLAVAPFDAAQAKAHQEAWAKHLGVPVEYTNSIGMKFRLIPPGEYTMGSTPTQIMEWSDFYSKEDQDSQDRAKGEGPQHKVILTKPFYLGVYEVTQKQYEQVMGDNPVKFNAAAVGKDTSNFPVDSMSWASATAFCERLNAGQPATARYRLPTEAEWEYACRGGTPTRYWFGDSAEKVREYEHFGGATQEVGLLLANPFGLFDMNGNVREWTNDWWSRDEFQQFANQPAVDPVGAKDGKWRVVRGGSWGVGAEQQAQASLRLYDRPAGANVGYGFRVVLPVEGVPKTAGQNPLFLNQLQETSVEFWEFKPNWGFNKHGCIGLATETDPSSRIVLGGVPSPHGIFAHPKPNGISSVKYDIGPLGYESFSTIVGVADYRMSGPTTPHTFEVYGDGKLLWKSEPVPKWGVPQECRNLSVKGVKELELRVVCPGDAGWGISVWCEPRLHNGEAVANNGNSPPAAVAPFDANQAKAHQNAWAEHLEVPVEFTNSLGMKFRLIPPGEFLMGSPDGDSFTRPDEKPQHKVRITKPYYLGTTEVSQKLWTQMMKTTPWKRQHDEPKDRNAPATYVTWNESVEFCRRLTEKESSSAAYRLPTEAEWEFAYRAGTTSRYPTGDDTSKLPEYGWNRFIIEQSGPRTPRPVGQKLPNAFGVYDMVGNAWEWVSDWHSAEFYANSPVNDPIGPASGTHKPTRGGGYGSGLEESYRSARREPAEVSARGDAIGFRVVLPISAAKSETAAK